MEIFKRGRTIEGGEDFIREKLNVYAYIWALLAIFISFLVVFKVSSQLWDFFIKDEVAIRMYTSEVGMTYENAVYSRIFLFGLNLLNIFAYVMLIKLKKAGFYLIFFVSLLSLFVEAFYFDGFQLSDLRTMTGFFVMTALLFLSGENNSWKKLT